MRGTFSAIGAICLAALLYWGYQSKIEEERKQKLGQSQAFFDALCQKEAGEFIYKTVDNVEGVFQMRLRDGGKDYFDRIRMKDYPEDPYGHTNREADNPQALFVSPPDRNYRFFENTLPSMDGKPPAGSNQQEDAKYRRYYGRDYRENKPMKVEHVGVLKSRYGYTWRGIERAEFQPFEIRGGEIVVVDLQTKEVLAVKRGFINFQTRGICPADKTEEFVYTFVSKVLRPLPPTRKIGE